ncbi:unnamed protein product, partial [Musa banksii]
THPQLRRRTAPLADADVSLPRIRSRHALAVSIGPRPAQRWRGKKMQSVDGEEIGVRGRLAEPQHVGIAALHPEAPSEEQAPRFGGVREGGVQNRQFVSFSIGSTQRYTPFTDII